MSYIVGNYERGKEFLLNDKSVCLDNRKFFAEFFEKQEYKLKRMNGLTKLDDSAYQTLYGYTQKFRNINKWFNNKPWKDITEKDFRKFYDAFEDGEILNQNGLPFKDKRSYYNKVFRSKPFEMLGKKEMVEKVMEFHNNKHEQEVRFIEEDEVRKIIDVLISPEHKMLAWLAFDIGENINALVQLRKKDFVRQIDKDTNMPEYRVNLHKEILKRSRRPRNVITNYQDTVKFIDIVLKRGKPVKTSVKDEKGEFTGEFEYTYISFKDDENVFQFSYAGAKKIMDRAVKIVGSKCLPNGQKVTWKDLRSSMACNLLKKEWSVDEVNSRLGHKPSSAEIDKYVNFLALDDKKPQRKVYEHNLAQIQAELDKSKELEKLQSRRTDAMKEKMDEWEKKMELLEKVEKAIELGLIKK